MALGPSSAHNIAGTSVEQPDPKRRKMSPPALPSALGLGAALSADQNEDPSRPTAAGDESQPLQNDVQPDEDNAAPPSTQAGVHAKPLSALFAGAHPAAGIKGKGKAKAKENDREGFESILARLQDGGTLKNLFPLFFTLVENFIFSPLLFICYSRR